MDLPIQPQERRVIRIAAIIAAQYDNTGGDVVAYNRKYHAKTTRAAHFWHLVGRTLFRPYRCQGWAGSDLQRWDFIRAEQARLGITKGA